MKWTERQREAIELRGKDMLVSAAAGSGKTAVLVERIKQLIIQDQVSIDNILVVTFTNAAAAEMKEKIIKALNGKIEKQPKASYFLRKQLNILYKANISTFHAFAMGVIRRYFYVINIDPNFKICDEAEAAILRGEAMDQLFEEMFEGYAPDFVDFLERYSGGRNENPVKEMILHTYLTLQSVPEPWKWLEENVEALKAGEEDFLQSKVFAVIKEQIADKLEYAESCYRRVHTLLSDNGVESLAVKCNIELEAVEGLASRLRNDDIYSFYAGVNAFRGERYAAKKDEKEVYEEIKDAVKFLRDKGGGAIKDIKSVYCGRTIGEHVEDINATYGQVKCLGDMVRRFAEIYRQTKEEKNLIDFSDIEHFALEILKNEDVAAEYRNKFEYVFIDEYQDSNLIQETLINSISRGGNVFMVGDVKQSIYKFRLAEPEIFMKKYELYKNSVGGSSAKIDLNMNFRSKGQIIEKTNTAFSMLMEGYDKDAALYKGVEYDGPLDYCPELHIVDSSIPEDLELDEEIKELKKGELEALAAAEIINDALGKPIFDGKKGAERPLCKKDIVILMRSTKSSAETFRKIFTDSGIPIHITDGEGYFDTLEIEIFLNLLRVIDNKKQDIPLLSVLHSVIFEFSAEELIQIRIGSKNMDFASAFEKYGIEGNDGVLMEKSRKAWECLGCWRAMSKNMSLDDFLWQLMWETGYYTYNGALPAGSQRQANLRALIDKAVKFSAMQMSGLYSFITYIESVKARGVKMGQVSLTSENDDVVRLMTIHKSKGLEYPMVIVAGLGRRFNHRGDTKRAAIHKDMGISLRRVEPREHWYRKTIIQNAIERKINRESLEEEVRVLYVAFTRAMDRLVLLGSVNNMEKAEARYDLMPCVDLESASCYLDLLVPVLKEAIGVKLHERSFAQNVSQKREDKRACLWNVLKGTGGLGGNPETRALIERKLSFRYGFAKESVRKSKYSVTELNQAQRGIERYAVELAVPRFTEGKRDFSKTELGTILHTVMEHLDFDAGVKAWESGRESGQRFAASFLRDLEVQEILLPKEADGIPLTYVDDFLNSHIGRRAAKARKMYKELPFTLEKELEGAEIMVQGVMDCCFEEEDGGFVILDYKSNYMEDDSKEEVERLADIYRNQLAIYKEALEVIRGVRVKECYLYLFSIGREVLVL